VLAVEAVDAILDSRGTVAFLQERIGSHGTAFRIIKLWTMTREAEQ
jgi:lipopolysaccharide/colanic/teichoic acid biosynthesis glycosyltransferase